MDLMGMADRAVNRLGLGQNLINHVPRHYRWTSLIALSALLGGAVTLLMSLSGLWRGYILGNALYLVALALGAFLQIFGPLRRATVKSPLDERERAMRTRAFNISGMTVAGVAMVGAWSMPTLMMVDYRVVANPSFWLIIALFLTGLFSIIPSLFISWATKPLPSDGWSAD